MADDGPTSGLRSFRLPIMMMAMKPVQDQQRQEWTPRSLDAGQTIPAPVAHGQRRRRQVS